MKTADYTYTDDLLTGLTTASTTYSFTYGDFSLRSGVYIGQRILAQYTYSERNNFLERLDYGNGDSVQYEYDQQGRVTSQAYEDGDIVTYRYDNNGALASVTDSATGRTTTYYYDFTNRLMKYVESGDVDHSVRYTYDDQNKLTDLVEVINGVTQTTHYTYDDDQRISSIQNGDKVISYTYDEYGRVSQKTDGIFTYAYTYKSASTGAPSNQIDTVTVMLNGTACTTFQYTYDDNGNILSVNNTGLTNTYVYDSAGQLIRENNDKLNKTWVWTYDDAGNILSKTEYTYTTGTLGEPLDTIVYTYGDTAWGDLLTAYDGVAITYDEMGNPLSDGTWTYTWEHGRQLASMTDGITTWTYTYDANGMRTSRSNGTDTYSYVYNGSKLMQMTVGSNVLTFTYDGSGNPSTVTLNGTTYHYITNLQGDVIEICTSTGTKVCRYDYDAWGNLVHILRYVNDSIYKLNPLLYRGYVYDLETGLYYLQSRYYNPKIGRFINADAYTSTGQGIIGNNMFAYCGNNPVNCSDPSGMIPQAALSLFDYYIIHKIVQMMIVTDYGYAMEVYVKDAEGKRGFLDLYDYTTNQYYEVKHAQYDIEATEKQMQRYDTSTIKSWMFKEYTLADSPSRGMNMGISGSFAWGDYSVEYYAVAPGLIHYSISQAETRRTALAYHAIYLNDKENKQYWAAAGLLFFGGGAPKECALGDDTGFVLGVT